MPLDGHSFLVAQGWSGKGKGLRQGAISRALAIPQKKTLSGLGKDRDDAFPFWDHLFSAAAKSIRIKVSDDEESESDHPAEEANLLKTTTGILSNRKPTSGKAAVGSQSTNDAEAFSRDKFQIEHRTSLLVTAKREAAKKGLYSRFFRGPVIGSAEEVEDRPVQKFSEVEESPKKKRKSEAEEAEKKERKRLRQEKRERKAMKRQRREECSTEF